MKPLRITPGPWAADGFVILDDQRRTIAMAWPNTWVASPESLSRMNANAEACAAVPAMIESLLWIREIATANLEQDEKLRSQGARTLNRIIDRAEATLKQAGVEL